MILSLMPTKKSHAIIGIVIKEAIKKVIKAMDLQVQRLQNETIELQNTEQKALNLMSKLKLQEIAEWTEKQRTLFKEYYDELWKVKSYISGFQKVKQIVNDQANMLKVYKRAWQLIKNDDHFNLQELAYMDKVYTGMLQSTVQNIDELGSLINAFTTKMTDGKRLELIAAVVENVRNNANDLNRFTNSNMLLSLQRSKNIQELQFIRKYYGLNQ